MALTRVSSIDGSQCVLKNQHRASKARMRGEAGPGLGRISDLSGSSLFSASESRDYKK